MSVLPGATNTTIANGCFTAVSSNNVNVGAQNDILALFHSHSATAGLLDAQERFDAPKCGEGTRTSMILGMKKFVQDGGAASSPALYWLHGPAGVGKSALAQSLSLELKSEGDHAASFFFSRTSPGRSNGDKLIVTLAYQLATNFPALQPFMSKVVRENPAVLTAANVVQMQSLIIDPINEWQKKYRWSVQRWAHKIFHSNKKLHPRLILIDGLDECSNPDVQKDLIRCIGVAIHQLSVPLRFVVVSRPGSHILATFELDAAFQGPSGVTVTKTNLGDDGDADERITTFLLQEFAEICRVHPIRNFLPEPWPRPDQIEQLVSKSSKGFIYPATVIRYIKMNHNRPDECLERILGLSAIPTSDKPYEPLDFLYRCTFEESVPEANKTSVLNIFHFLVLPTTWDGATSTRTIESHFGYKPDYVQYVLHDLLCLVAFTPDGCIKILHASLPDFLLDQSRSGPLYIDVSDARATVTASHLLDVIGTDTLPHQNEIVAFLKHVMETELTNKLIHRRLLEMDLVSWYKRYCHQQQQFFDAQFQHTGFWCQYTGSWSPHIELQSLLDVEFPAGILGKGVTELIPPPQTIAFTVASMMAYLLVVAVKGGSQQYINDQIASIKAHILQICPFVSSVHLVYDKLIPAMIPLFHKWTSTVYDKHINYIFALELAPSQYQIRQDISELHFFMMVPFCSANTTLALQLKERTDKNKATKPINWADVVQGRDNSDY